MKDKPTCKHLQGCRLSPHTVTSRSVICFRSVSAMSPNTFKGWVQKDVLIRSMRHQTMSSSTPVCPIERKVREKEPHKIPNYTLHVPIESSP